MVTDIKKTGQDVPVLFIVFNRPDHTDKVLDAIRDKNKKVVKTIWNGLFSKLKSKKRENEGGSESKPSKRVGPLWVLANIGLERVNEVTGTNMRLNSKSLEEKFASVDDDDEVDRARSAN